MAWPALAWAGTGAWLAVLFFFSARPGDALERWNLWGIPDRWLHFAGYLVLAVLLRAALELTWHPRAGRGSLWAVLGSVLSGVLDELHQSFVPRRDASAADVAADGFGALAAQALFAAAVRVASGRRRS